ncbi:MAG TPA: neutral zinc metallopeptidase [Planctomycetota bacterium]|nr:neutral zinc metallopeptidase [Planctomycetota bacterium]
MRTEGRRESANVEDRRASGGRVAMGGGIGLVAVVLIAGLFGVDLTQLLGAGGPVGAPTEAYVPTPEEEEQARFVKVVLADTEDVWNALFAKAGKRYEEPPLVLFSRQVSSACGMASAAVGPFYCPGDRKAYIDLSFFQELETKFGAKGDFARAYVIAHEIGHHVQNLLGTSDKVHQARGRVSQVEYNRLSVRLELQADFYAGVWAHHMKKVLDPGDIKEALEAAHQIGDDTLQRQAQGHVVPDSFTHGTSAERVAWFSHGFATGDPAQGDTFNEEVFRRVNPPSGR